LSVERRSDSVNWFAEPCLPDPFTDSNTSTSVPSGRTTIWLPIVNTFAFVGMMLCAGSQLAPPFVVRERYASPRKANECSCSNVAFSPGLRLRSQMA
jgi:hypothetical protein